jgi:hypothetical protein
MQLFLGHPTSLLWGLRNALAVHTAAKEPSQPPPPLVVFSVDAPRSRQVRAGRHPSTHDYGGGRGSSVLSSLTSATPAHHTQQNMPRASTQDTGAFLDLAVTVPSTVVPSFCVAGVVSLPFSIHLRYCSDPPSFHPHPTPNYHTQRPHATK